jgi:hypothetical protein
MGIEMAEDVKKECYLYGEWRKAVNLALLPRDPKLMPNPLRQNSTVGSIHKEEEAKKVGMRGGVVAGTEHLELLAPLLEKTFGRRIFETGSISMFYTYAILHGEQARALLQLPAKGDKDFQLDARVETPDGHTVAEGTVSVGIPKERSYVHSLKLPEGLPGDLRILKGTEIGWEMPLHDVSYNAERAKARLERIEDSIPWYLGDSPWGGAIVPFSSVVGMMMLSTGRTYQAVGFYGATSLYFVNGPAKVDVQYQAKSKIIAIGATSKTEFYWFDAELIEKATGKQIAGMRMMIRLMKTGSPLYPELK